MDLVRLKEAEMPAKDQWLLMGILEGIYTPGYAELEVKDALAATFAKTAWAKCLLAGKLWARQLCRILGSVLAIGASIHASFLSVPWKTWVVAAVQITRRSSQIS